MTLYELFDVLASGYERIDFLWNFFIVVHLTIAGALFLINRHITIAERIVAIFAYLGFLYVNYNALTDAYAFQIEILADIAKMEVPLEAPGGDMAAHARSYNLPDRIAFIDYAFLAAAGLTVLALSFANLLSRDQWERRRAAASRLPEGAGEEETSERS